MECNRLEHGIALLAEGGTDPQAAAHVAACPACAERLARLARLVAAARLRPLSAPAGLVARAAALMRPRPRLVARLLGNGLAATGARRGDARDFALHAGVDGFSIRLSYAPLPGGGWEVLGRAPTADWSLAHEGGVAPCGPSGRFRLVVSGLGETSFVLSKDGTEIEVPSAEELIRVGA